MEFRPPGRTERQRLSLCLNRALALPTPQVGEKVASRQVTRILRVEKDAGGGPLRSLPCVCELASSAWRAGVIRWRMLRPGRTQATGCRLFGGQMGAGRFLQFLGSNCCEVLCQ